MDHLGHGLALQHPVFQHPFKAEFEWVEEPRPKHYEGFTSPLWPKGVPATYRLASFEIGKPDGFNPTLVSHEGFFTDVPGFENLAEGHSAKALGSLSLARQGKHFYWGYSIDPDRMTAGAKDTLVNALYYMHSKRDSLTVQFVCKTRASFKVYTYLGRDSEPPYMRGVEEHLPGSLMPKARATYTRSFEGAETWVSQYLDYIYAGKAGMIKDKKYGWLFDIDEDAMKLGTPNSSRKSLERWIALSKGDQAEDKARALRCLERYVHPKIAPKDGNWTRWYATYKDLICFIDSTGFWWQLDPIALERSPTK